MALLVVALATIVAVNMMVRAETQFRRAQLQLHGEQAMQYVFAAEQWVAQILYRDRRDSTFDHLGEAWAMDLPPLPVDGGAVFGRLDDMQGRFNLTNLVTEDGVVDQAQMRQLERLLDVLGLADQVSPQALLDYIDPDQEPTSPGGAEDGYYLTQDPPHRTADRPLVTLSELVPVRDFEYALLEVVDGHIITLPRRTALNVNTATPEVLSSLADELSLPLMESLADSAEASGFESLESFRAALGVVPDPGLPLALATDYFRLTVQVDIGTVNLTMYSLLERLPDGRTRVVARQRTPW